MRFVLCRAVTRCQARRLRAVAAAAPLPAAIVMIMVALAPVALARVGGALGNELGGALTSSEVATALVLGPCLAAAAAGAVLAVSLPTRAGLGQQIAAGPCGDRSAIGAGLVLPSVLAGLIVLPSLLSLSLALADGFAGGYPAGLALTAAILAAVPAGAVVAEGVQIAVRGRRIRLLGIGIGLGAWVATGSAMGATPLGPLAPVSLTLRGTVSAWIALGAAGVTATGLGIAWILLAASRPEQRSRTTRRRHLDAAWRFPVPAAASSLIVRRSDVRRANVAALGFGAIGALIAVASGAEPPGPFLLATTTTLLGSLVAALAGWGALAAGAWMWLGAPRGRGAIAAITWQSGLVAAAVPVGIVALVAAFGSGADWRTVGVVAVLVVVGTAVATIAGSLVPWQGDGIGDQLSSLAAFVAVAIATSFIVGLIAPRLTGLGLPDPAIAILLCGLLSCVAIASLLRRLEIGE